MQPLFFLNAFGDPPNPQVSFLPDSVFFKLLVISSHSLHVFLSVVQEWTAKADFTHHAHTASISAVAASERFVVTGSKDETIQLYDMKKRVEHGALLHHDGECLR